MRMIHTLPLLMALGGFVPHAQAAEPVPQRGLSMDKVLKQYGEPQQRLQTVGKPPITRWIYPDFTVYFEHKRTLHSVRHHKRAAHSAAH